VVRQLLEWLAGDGNSQRTHLGEVRSGQVPSVMQLTEHHLPSWTEGHPPVVNASLQRAAMTVLELARVLLLDPVEEGLRLKPRFALQERFHLMPYPGERILPRPVRARLLHRARKPPQFAILACRFLVHTRPPGRHGQLPSEIQIPPQLPCLSIRDHRNPPRSRKLRI
jgi:hypothetical protein